MLGDLLTAGLPLARSAKRSQTVGHDLHDVESTEPAIPRHDDLHVHCVLLVCVGLNPGLQQQHHPGLQTYRDGHTLIVLPDELQRLRFVPNHTVLSDGGQ